MIAWQYYPKSDRLPLHLHEVLEVFKTNIDIITSRPENGPSMLSSNEVLAKLCDPLRAIGYQVEGSKRSSEKVAVPVLFGRNGVIEKSFNADAFNAVNGTVLEIEAGRAVMNNAFLKDLFQACMMQDVQYLVIAVRILYTYSGGSSNDFDIVSTWFDTLYASRRLQLPIHGVLVVGY